MYMSLRAETKIKGNRSIIMRIYSTTSFGTGFELLEQTRVHEMNVSHSPLTPTPPLFEGKEILSNTSQSWIETF